MRLLVFGGSFDPPHVGHMSLLASAIAAAQPDKVLVVPAGLAPHKQASATPAKLRLEMCACFVPLWRDVEVSDIEIERGGKSYTIDTVEQLERIYPGAELALCVGSDMLLGFEKWHRWQELLQRVLLVVQSREDGDMPRLEVAAEALRKKGGRVLFARGAVRQISSTELRARIAEGRGDGGLVPPPADEIVRRMGLYRPQISPEQARELARSMLSAQRFEHSQNVAAQARSLAKIYGESEQKAELAAWLHDILKEQSPEALLQIAGQDDIIAKSVEQRPQAVWHGPCAAVYARRQLGVQDGEVLSAIGCHTTGKPGMSKLDKILLVADMTSAERDYPGAENLRRLANEDLDKAALEVLRRSTEYVAEKGKRIDEESLQALGDLEQKLGKPDEH